MKNETSEVKEKRKKRRNAAEWKKDLKNNYDLYLLSLIPLTLLLIFFYWPMYGVQIAFRDYIGTKGFFGSPWVGLEHFERLFNSYNFIRLLKNTITLSLYSMIAGFPLPIILALLLNETRSKVTKKTVQMVSYAPHFISTVLIVGIITLFFDRGNGFINNVLEKAGMERIAFLAEPKIFKHIYVWSGVWQGAGWGSIIYMSALAGIDPELKNAASIDGASRFQKIIHVDIPGILPTAVTLLILNTGSIMNVAFDKAFLMQNDLNMEASEVISTYIYKVGLVNAEYSFSTAVGLFNSVINLVMIIIVNKVAKTIGETSLW